ncbi:MAG: MMPL family transporter [Wenzhouxiangella sp.]|jgi:predicted RND superfamily exporter protein|nr:MMPL family transporter [Wenzhouxiangella sp.]
MKELNLAASGTLRPGLRVFLNGMLRQPFWVVVIALVALIPFGVGLSKIEKDPSVDAFVPQDHPAAAARDQAREWFGLEDPIVIALIGESGRSVFTANGLSALRELHEKVEAIPGVRSADVISLHNKNLISGKDGDLQVDPIIEPGLVTEESARVALERVRAMPMLMGLLATHKGNVATIVAPVNDPNRASHVYDQIMELTAEAPEGMSWQVAGVAGMNARLAAIVDGDTRVFIPAAILTVLLIVWLALRQPAAVVGPLVVIAGSAATALGVLGWSGADYYLITSALPVVIMALAVADSMHLSVYYLRYRTDEPTLDARQAIILALSRTWLPISLTSLTTIAAFTGLSLGADMQPIREFGLFAAVGVAAAWLLSLTMLPAIIVLTDLKPSTSAMAEDGRAGLLDRALRSITRLSWHHPIATTLGLAALVGTLIVLALDARFDYERKRYFQPQDPVRIADQAINHALGGISFLDVTVTAPEPGGIMTVEALEAIAALRTRMARLPQVVRVSGIDESIAKMHEVLTAAPPGTLPDRALAPAQYMFLYEASSEPEDFRHEVDYDHSRALIRAQLATDRYSTTRPIVRELEQMVDTWSAESGLQAAVSGRVAVNEGWMSRLAERHFVSLGLAAVMVFVASVIAFRAVGPALLAMVPVGIGVLFVYATMGLLGVDIAPATSMTAAIATGLGVDFGIHLIAHMRTRLRAGATLEEALSGHYQLVARACFFSAVALGVALAVISLSGAPPLRWFGLLVSAGAFGSLIGALLVLPALLVLSRPFFLWRVRHA